MAKLLTMPRLGETMEQGTVRSWLIKAGVPYKRGDVIAEVETDKTVVELPALEDGVVEKFLASDGDVVSVGGALAELVGEASFSGEAQRRPENLSVAAVPASSPKVSRVALRLPGMTAAFRLPQPPASWRRSTASISPLFLPPAGKAVCRVGMSALPSCHSRAKRSADPESHGG